MTAPDNDDIVRGLVSWAIDYAKSKRRVAAGMDDVVCSTINYWLDDMLIAAQQGDTHRVQSISARVSSKLKDELAYQLHQQRRERDRQRG
jgi:hypothetical protein